MPKTACNTICLCSACSKRYCTEDINCMRRCFAKGKRKPIVHCDNFQNRLILRRRYKIRRVKPTERLIDITYYNFQFPNGCILYHLTYSQIKNLKHYYPEGKVLPFSFEDGY